MAAAAASPRTSTATAMDPPPPTARSVRHGSPAAAMQPPPSASSQALKTPLSSTYPNSIHSPLQSTAPRNKLNSSSGDVKTPLTPPSAYLDFLRVLSPNPYTPSPLSTGTSTRFSHDNSNYPSPAWPSATLRDDKHLLRPTISSARSTDSGSSFSSVSSASSSALSAAAGAAASNQDRSSAPPQANTSKPLHRPSELAFGRASSAPTNASSSATHDSIATTTVSVTDPSTGTRTTEIVRPQTARAALQPGTPRLIIPPSPSSTIETMSPAQHSAPATTANVPHSATPPSAMSATAQSAALRSAGAGWTPASAVMRENLWAKAAGRPPPTGPSSGRAPTPAGGVNAARDPSSPAPGGTSSPVTIKHVVTRTVTYHRRPGAPPIQGPARPGAGSAVVAAARSATTAQSPLSAVEAIPEESEEEERERKATRRPLIGDAPRGKRRRVE